MEKVVPVCRLYSQKPSIVHFNFLFLKFAETIFNGKNLSEELTRLTVEVQQTWSHILNAEMQMTHFFIFMSK